MSAFLLNPRAGPLLRGDDPGRGPLLFHRRLPGYAPTPLRRARAAERSLSARRVLVKDESNRFGLPAFKILGASWAFYRELQEARRFSGDDWRDLEELAHLARDALPPLLVTATDGNHGRGVARVARWFGIGAEVFVPAGTAPARIAAIESEGARVSVVAGDYDAAVAAAAAHAQAGGPRLIQDTAWPGYERVPRWIVEGYATIMREIETQLEQAREAPPGLVAVQIGVGSLAAAVVQARTAGAPLGSAACIGVEPDTAACAFASASAGRRVTVPGPHPSAMAGLNCGTLSSTAWPLLERGVDAFVTVGDETAFEAVRLLAQDGIVSGESGAAGLAGLLALARDPAAAPLRRRFGIGPGMSALVISTEGITDPDLGDGARGPISRGR